MVKFDKAIALVDEIQVLKSIEHPIPLPNQEITRNLAFGTNRSIL